MIALTLTRMEAALLLMLAEHAAEDVLPETVDIVEDIINRLKQRIDEHDRASPSRV